MCTLYAPSCYDNTIQNICTGMLVPMDPNSKLLLNQECYPVQGDIGDWWESLIVLWSHVQLLGGVRLLLQVQLLLRLFRNCVFLGKGLMIGREHFYSVRKVKE